MSERIIESMINFKYFRKLRQTRKETRSHFFSRYFLSKTPEKREIKKPNVNFVFKFSDYKSLYLDTSQDIFIKELKKIDNSESKIKFDMNTFYSDKEVKTRNINVMMNIMNRNKKCRKYFKYNNIDDELIKILLSYSNHKLFKKDSIIFKAGSKQAGFYFLIRGKVSLKSMNADIIRRNVRRNRYKMESIYNNIKAEEKINLQNISDDEDDALSLDNFVSKTNLDPIIPDQNLLKLKAKLSIKSTSSKKNATLIRRSKNRITTLKVDTVANTRSIVQEKILIENFAKIQKDLSATIKIYDEGDFFCDWELIYDKPHTETAYAEEDSDLLILQKKYFDKYFSNHFIKTDNDRKIFLTKRIEFLHINNVLNLKPEFYDRGKVIYTKFDPANEFFVVYKGKGALMDLNDDYIYRKKSDIIYNVKDMKIVCYVGEGCVVGLESFNDGLKKYDNNFVIEEDNTVIYRIKMNTINMDNYLKKKNKMKLKKQLNEMYLNQNEMLPKTNTKKLTSEEKIYKRKEEKLNDVFFDAKKFFWKKLQNEKRINTIYGDIVQIGKMNKYLTEKKILAKKAMKSSKKLSTLDIDNTGTFKRRSKFHFLTTINKSQKPIALIKGKEQNNGFPLKNNLKNTLDSMKSEKKEKEKEKGKENNLMNKFSKRPSFIQKRFSMFSFNFKNTLFKDDNLNGNNKNKIIEEKEENFFDFYGDTNNNEFMKTTDEKFKKKKLTSDFFDEYVYKTINVNKNDINYNSGNFRIPLFGVKKAKK